MKISRVKLILKTGKYQKSIALYNLEQFKEARTAIIKYNHISAKVFLLQSLTACHC